MVTGNSQRLAPAAVPRHDSTVLSKVGLLLGKMSGKHHAKL